jgi:hypothetical protein
LIIMILFPPLQKWSLSAASLLLLPVWTSLYIS